nr:hypothetical protein [Deltaproteobacteria bacterium]
MTFVFAIFGQLLGCGVPLPAPIVESVEPARGWNGEDTLITILGEGFVPQVTFDASSTEGEADLDRDFEVILVDEAGVEFPLTGVSVASYEQLTAFVTAGLVPGLYDLDVVSPGGTRTSLPDAYVVSATRADHITLEVTSVAFDVGMLIPIEVKLWDPNGERVLEDVEVELRASGDDGPFLVDWGSGGLEDRVDSVDGSSITGRLGSDGYAPLALRIYVPQTVTFTVTPLSDAGLLGDELKIAITPTSDFQVDIELPSEDFVAEAGVPFDAIVILEDELGNPLPERFEEVVVEDACGGWFAKVLVTGSAVVPVTLGVPTGEEPCLVQTLLVEAAGTSEEFTVVPGLPFRFRVSAGPIVVPAGDAVRLVIEAEDVVGNPTPWSGVLNWSDGVTGGILEDCTVAGTQHLCDLPRTVARPIDIIRVEGDDGTFGVSPPFAVVPGTEVDALGITIAPSVVAGELWLLTLTVLDAFGNAIDPAGYPVSDYTITDDRGEVDCLFSSFAVNFTASWDCTLYTAGTAVLHVVGPDGATIDAATLVINGPPAVAYLDAPAVVAAGELFVVSGDVEDAWGNPVLVPALTVIDLTDDTVTLTPTLAVIGPAGSFDEAVTLTAAGVTQVSASYDGVLIGHSGDITVVAAEAVRLRVEPAEPWVWIGEPIH